MSSNPKLDLDELIADLERALPAFSAFKSYEIVDRTDATVKIKIHIAKELYIQLYANSEKGKLNLALVHGTQRIYGEDSEGRSAHLHPFEAPESHLPLEAPISLSEFLNKMQRYLEDQGLI